MPQCAGGPARVHRVSSSLVWARSLLEDPGGSDSSALVCQCHWRCTAGAHCRMTSMKLGEYVMFESAVACPQPRNDHLIFFTKEVVCILSVIKRMLLKPSSPLPFLHCRLCFLKRDFMFILRQLPTILRRSVSFLVPWDITMGWNPLDGCSLSGLLQCGQS